MDFINKISENFKIPHLFRDVFYTLGGLIIVSEYFVFYNVDNIRWEAILSVGTTNYNFITTVLLFSFSYFVGRTGVVVVELFYQLVKFVNSLLTGIIIRPEDFLTTFFRSLKELRDGGRRKNFFRKVTKYSPNQAQVLSYIGSDRTIADYMERLHYTDIFYSHLFIIFGVAYYFFDNYALVLIMAVLLWRKYCNGIGRDNLYHDAYDTLVYRNSEPEEANRLIKEMEARRMRT